MEVTFWGVRGSIPTPGKSTERWGGNSSCLEVRHEGQPPLVFDCGTGARKLGFKLVGDPSRELDLIFTHFHMDHLFGFPFFVPIYTPGYKIRITIPAYTEEEARQKLGRYLNGVYHPTRLRELPAEVTFRPIRAGKPFVASGFTITGIALNHPGGSVGYKIEIDGQKIAYMTDSAPFARPGEGVAAGKSPSPYERRVLDFLKGCQMVIYDTMYELDEYMEKMTWGHSYPEYAHALCAAANVEQLYLFHHLPDATDEALDARAQQWAQASNPTVVVAREGDAVSVEG
ncbi:MAG: MBL fold metallo-hydrolase [Proteobacteria bacterium]|nr:MBL fold metallo-hydrolase [Pseudomonadota bacterium]